MTGFPKVTAKYPEIQRDVCQSFIPDTLRFRVGTHFDKQLYLEQYEISLREIEMLDRAPDVLNAHDIIFQRMEEAMRRRIEEIKSAKVKYMVDQILNINPN